MDNNSLSASVNNTNMFSSVLSNACFCASLLKELAFFNSSTNVWVVVLIHFIITSFSTQCKKLILRSSFVLLTICSILALNNFNGLNVYNLGTGNGYSVLQLVKTFEKVNNVEIPYEIVERRPGDIGSCYASPLKAYNELGFKAELDIEDMVKDAYNYAIKNK